MHSDVNTCVKCTRRSHIFREGVFLLFFLVVFFVVVVVFVCCFFFQTKTVTYSGISIIQSLKGPNNFE